MPKLVKKVTHDFTVINNKIFRDQNLKGIDRGILGTMLSLADGWNFSIKGLAAILPDGETAISNSLKRITKAHYLIRRRVYKNGKITDWEYIISDEPMEFDDESDTSETVSDTVDSINNSATRPVFQKVSLKAAIHTVRYSGTQTATSMIMRSFTMLRTHGATRNTA